MSKSRSVSQSTSASLSNQHLILHQESPISFWVHLPSLAGQSEVASASVSESPIRISFYISSGISFSVCIRVSINICTRISFSVCIQSQRQHLHPESASASESYIRVSINICIQNQQVHLSRLRHLHQNQQANESASTVVSASRISLEVHL